MNNDKRHQGKYHLLIILAIPALLIAIFIIQRLLMILGLIFLLLIIGWFMFNYKRR